MGQARELMDKVTDALLSKNLEALRDLYSPDVVAVTPDSGTLHGVDRIIEYFTVMNEAMPDATFESTGSYETADCAIDQGELLGTNTGDMRMPDGGTLPATGKQVRLRTSDIANVEGGRIVRHEWYWDQLDFLTQLGVIEAPATAES